MVSPISFLQETKDELIKVTWPTRQEVIRLTGLVIVISAVIGGLIGGLDFLLTNAITILLK